MYVPQEDAYKIIASKSSKVKWSDQDAVPMTTMIVRRIHHTPSGRPLVVLLDTGSTSTWISAESLPKGAVPRTVDALESSTLTGKLKSNQEVDLEGIVLPELQRSRILDCHRARVFYQKDCRYDVILGRDALRKLKIILDFKDDTVIWGNAAISMRTYPTAVNKKDFAMAMLIDVCEKEDLISEEYEPWDNDEAMSSDNAQGYRTPRNEIRPSNYEAYDVKDVAQGCFHLTQEQRDQLQGLLEQFTELFSGKLGLYPHEKISLELVDNAVPHRSRPFTVPRAHESLFKRELDKLVRLGVLEPCGRAEWIAGTFIVPKRDGSARFVSDFRGLNKFLKRKVYPMPRIMDILARRKGYAFLSKLDISMQYYTFELTEESKNLCTIATPFGMYRYCRMPQGINQGPDIAQETMERIFRDIEDIENYFDDMAIFSDDWESHLQLLKTVLQRLQDNGFTVNPSKCEWGVKETDFLGYWLTPEGVKPWTPKIDAILRMKEPSNLSELRSFIGLVNYYRDMWPKRAEILAPLTTLTGKAPFKWTKDHRTAFKKMKAVVASEALLHYPDHNKPFDIETDASDYQLGAVIKQDGKPVAYYSRKLNPAQRNYTTIEKELLSIVETLKTFRQMLLGAELRIYTDHKNLTQSMTSFTTQRVLRWRLLLEEYGPTFLYKKGEHNVVADALSRLPASASEMEGLPTQPNDELLTILDFPELVDCFLEHPAFDGESTAHPFRFKTIHHYQQLSTTLKDLVTSDQRHYETRTLGGRPIICRKDGSNFLIALSDEMLPNVVRFYHEATAHAEGEKRLLETLSRHYYHPRLSRAVKEHVSRCRTCQTMKIGSRQYGKLAPRDAQALPWHEVHVDTIGPWHFELPRRSRNRIEFLALTSVDPVTLMIEVNLIENKTSATVANCFENNWLSRYPRPLRCVHDQGLEFVGQEFQDLLERAGIDDSVTTPRNPQGNSIIERTHQTIAQVIRTLKAIHEPTTVHEAKTLITKALATAMHAIRCASTSALQGMSPGGLVFRRDMFLDLPLTADILTLQAHRQDLVDQRLLRANAKRIRHDYAVNEQVLKKRHRDLSDKLQPIWDGPYTITTVHTNGTVTIRLDDHTSERINIRRIKPYRT